MDFVFAMVVSFPRTREFMFMAEFCGLDDAVREELFVIRAGSNRIDYFSQTGGKFNGREGLSQKSGDPHIAGELYDVGFHESGG